MPNQTQSLVDKYRPQAIEDLVLPCRHGLSKALEFLQAPYPSAWLLYGPPGIGKTSFGGIMARASVANEFALSVHVGPDLDSNRVRELAATCRQRPVWGGYYTILVNEGDNIPEVGQVRLLGLLEDIKNAVWIFTSNQRLDQYEPRFLSRLQPQSFTKEGMLEPATNWLLSIAEKEGIWLPRKIAERMVVKAKTNLRAALQALDQYRPTQMLIPPPFLLCEPSSNRRRAGCELPSNQTGAIKPSLGSYEVASRR